MPESAIFTVLVLVRDGDKILFQDRVDPGWHGVSLPGGHVEREESFVRAARREVYEETGLTIGSVRLRAIKQFRTKEDARYIVVYFETSEFSGELRSSSEGRMFWATKDEIASMEQVPELDVQLRAFEDDGVSEFIYERDGDKWKPTLL